MSEETITGVCVDIPTVILRAKHARECESLIEMLNQNIKPYIVEYISPKISDGWISVAERPPEEGVSVWVYYENNFGSHYESATLRRGSWESDTNYENILYCVSHWMNLPEPPKVSK